MGIYKIVNDLKLTAINTSTVNMSSFGDISLYNNKTNIKYPFVNFDIIRRDITNYATTYIFRIYVMDRNDPYIAYNKCELILNTILKDYSIDAKNYTYNFATLEFKDMINGCWADFEVMEQNIIDCDGNI